MTKTLCTILIMLCAAVVVHAQDVDEQKLDAFAHAVAKAEGFGVKGVIPTRYHNPGDIRSRLPHAYPGQVGLSRAGYVIFKNDRYGMKAFKNQIRLMALGYSKHFRPDMTLVEVAKVYTPIGWKAWTKNVARELDVDPTIELKDLLLETPPNYLTPGSPEQLRQILITDSPVMPTLKEQGIMYSGFAGSITGA